MQVILFENVEKLGMQGDVVNVASGYFRNYLGPRNKAVLATETNLKRLELKRKRLTADAEKQLGEAEGVARQLTDAKVHFVMKSPDGHKLFGSVHDHQILEQLVEQGFQLERRQILLPDPIKETGEHTVRVRLLGRVEGEVTVVVEPEEAPPEEAAAGAPEDETPETETDEAASAETDETTEETVAEAAGAETADEDAS